MRRSCAGNKPLGERRADHAKGNRSHASDDAPGSDDNKNADKKGTVGGDNCGIAGRKMAGEGLRRELSLPCCPEYTLRVRGPWLTPCLENWAFQQSGRFERSQDQHTFLATVSFFLGFIVNLGGMCLVGLHDLGLMLRRLHFRLRNLFGFGHWLLGRL